MKALFLITVVLVQSFLALFSVTVDAKAIDLVERAECKDNRDDCGWIAENNEDVEKYCNEHKNDAFIKDCTKTCGFCDKAPAPPLECEDTRSDCHWIVENNEDVQAYCDLYKNNTEVKKCAKTCGFCGKQPSPTKLPKECKDNRDDCGWIAENNEDVEKYCNEHKSDAFIKDCTKTCGFCKPPSPTKPPKCEDTSGDCSWIAKHYDDVLAYCYAYRNTDFVKGCRKTCENCKHPTPPKAPKCEDTRDDCSWIAKHNPDVEAYCKRHRNDTFIKQCTKTCAFCHIKPPSPPGPPQCEDTTDDCSWIAEHYDDVLGYCNRHRNSTFIKQCTKTCEHCKHPEVQKPQKCEDTSEHCPWIAKHYEDVEAFCKRHRNSTFIKPCSKTCGFCKTPRPTPKPALQKCEDTNDCSWIAKYYDDVIAYCERYKHTAFIRGCRKTCENCQHPAPSEPYKCEDTSNDCSWIAEHYKDDVLGYCNRHRNDIFIKHCTKTCKHCHHPEPSKPHECEDIDDDCSWITKNYDNDVEGYCKRHGNDTFIKQCAKTCRSCKFPAPTKPPQTCEDTGEGCKWIRENVKIQDLRSYCDIWKNDPAVRECPKTCGFC